MFWKIVENFELNQYPELKNKAIKIIKASNESIFDGEKYAIPDNNGKYKKIEKDNYNYQFFVKEENIYFLEDGSILI